MVLSTHDWLDLMLWGFLVGLGWNVASAVVGALKSVVKRG